MPCSYVPPGGWAEIIPPTTGADVSVSAYCATGPSVANAPKTNVMESTGTLLTAHGGVPPAHAPTVAPITDTFLSARLPTKTCVPAGKLVATPTGPAPTLTAGVMSPVAMVATMSPSSFGVSFTT